MRPASELLPTRSGLWRRATAVLTAHALIGAFAAACGGPALSMVPGPPVQVRIDPPGGDITTPVNVSVRAIGAPRLDCVAPCGMTAPAGNHLVQVSGPRTFSAIVNVPAYNAVGRVRFGNIGVRTTGLVFNAIGSAFVAVGGALTPVGNAGPLLLLGLASAGLLFLIPGLIMVVAAGPDTIEFRPWTEFSASRTAERRRLAAGAAVEGHVAGTSLVLAPAVRF